MGRRAMVAAHDRSRNRAPGVAAAAGILALCVTALAR